MCGVVGVISLGTPKKTKYLRVMEFLLTELLQATEERGKDATGVAVLFNDGMSLIQKGSVNATDFIGNIGDKDTTYNSFLENSRQYTQEANTSVNLFLGHCRKSSVGGAFDNINNHPIKTNRIIGVHNGTLLNHKEIFENLGAKRDGTVDTEAIMHLLYHYTAEGSEPFSLDGLEQVSRRLEGTYVVLAINENNPFQICFLRSKERPLEIALIRELDIMLIASERSFFTKALYQYNKYAGLFNVDENTPKINPEKVEVYTPPTDYVGFININTVPKEKQLLDDFVIKRDVLKATKIWKSTVVKTYNNAYTGVYGQQGVNNTSKKNESPSASTTTNTSTTTPKGEMVTTSNTGKVFCKKLGGYVPPEVRAEADKAKAKVFTIAGNKTEDVETYEVKKENKINLDSVETTPVSVETAPVPIIINEVKTVDETLVEAIKAAEQYTERLTKFTKGKEVAIALDITNADCLDTLPAHILVNRSREIFGREAFLAGAAWADRTGNDENAKKSVRIAKHVVDIFGGVITELAGTDAETYKVLLAKKLDTQAVDELTLVNLRNVFSKGNLFKNPPLRTLEELVESP